MASNILYSLFRNTTDAVFGVDGSGCICFWNDACSDLMRIPFDKVEGKPCYEVIAGRDLLGNPYCERDCRVGAKIKKGIPVSHYDLVVTGGDKSQIMVNVGVFVAPDKYRKKSEAVAFMVLRRVDCYRLIQRLASEKDFTWRECPSSSLNLTVRETDILRLASQGMSTNSIAEKLCISPTTVRNHFRNIFSKLDVHSRAEAVNLALRQNLI